MNRTAPPADLSLHLRAGRWAQRERPAASLPDRLRGSRYGVNSRFQPSWFAGYERGSGLAWIL
jgi:hypothetical protein